MYVFPPMRNKMKNPDILVVGGGASGIIAAITAAGRGASVTVLERGKKPLLKLLRTGNGRCNLTNTGSDRSVYHGTDPSFAHEILKNFSVQETISLFLGLGVYTTNHDGWVYPYSEQAESVAKNMLLECSRLHVKIKNNEPVTGIAETASGFDVSTETWTYHADRVILSTGSSASLSDSEDENGPALAASLGLPCVKRTPALVPLITENIKKPGWAGVRIFGKVSLYAGDLFICSEEGQLQLTDYGISGIPVFCISGNAAKLMDAGQRCSVTIDFFPEMDAAALHAFLDFRKESLRREEPDLLLTGLFPEKLIPVLTRKNTLTDTRALTETIKSFRLKLKGTLGARSAQVLGGGVSTDAVDPETCESRLHPGLFLTGELLDIDAACGGWNLQFAWSTGVLAGRAAAKEMDNV